ncbi:unnamed protein product, partial [Rotaria socialis]
MIRNHPPAVPSTTTSSSSPSSKPTTLPVTTSSSSFHDMKLLFDYDTLLLHQNQDPVIQKIKSASPLNLQYTLDDHRILYKLI